MAELARVPQITGSLLPTARVSPAEETPDEREELRRERMILVTAAGSPWLVRCEGCGVRRHRIALVALGTDLHLCRECLIRASTVVDMALRELAR